MTTRILKWTVPNDGEHHSLPGQFVHAEPMTETQLENAAWNHLRGDSGAFFLTVWTRVAEDEESQADHYKDRCLYRIYPTGEPIDDEMSFCATVKQGEYMLHLLARVDEFGTTR